MNKILMFFFFCMVALQLNAQQKITIEDVSKHVGDSVTVCGKIFGGKFLSTANNQPTFLNMGAAYPYQPLTIIIWGNTRKLFSGKPEEKFKGKILCVTGKISVFKNKPQIVVEQTEQIQEQ